MSYAVILEAAYWLFRENHWDHDASVELAEIYIGFAGP
jgi:hypothetical protein